MLYWLGVGFAVSSGISNNLGTLVQKKVVNDIPEEAKEQQFYQTLVRHPLWLLGLFFQFGIGTILFMFAQVIIGPVLIPGLMATGLIVLAIGSVKVIGEALELSDLLGIVMILLAIMAFTFSEFIVDIPGYAFLEVGFLIRIGSFTAVLIAMIIGFYGVRKRWQRFHAISQAVNSGLFLAISNYWIGPLMGTIVHVFSGTFVWVELGLFGIAAIILILTNILAVGNIQDAFKTGQVSLIIPIQQVPIQIVPGLVYLFLFFLAPKSWLSVVWFIFGMVLIILGSYLLAKRELLLEAIE